MAYFDKSYHPPGTPPGTLVEHLPVEAGEIKIHLIDYNGSDYTEKHVTDAEECQTYLRQDSVTWIHLHGQIRADTMQRLGEMFGLHPLAMEDVLNIGQRPKIEEYDEQLFIIMAMPVYKDDTVTVAQVSLFLADNYLISFCSSEHDSFEPLRNRLRRRHSSIRNLKADYLLYGLLDMVIDQGYPILENIGERVEDLEEAILATPSPNSLAEIHALRRELLLLRRMLWPQREVLNFLLREDLRQISDNTRLYLRDCYDHVIQIMDLVENYREMAGSMIDVYLSSVSHRLNEIMRVLTLIATIFIPLTFVAGVYGMNFRHPDSPWAMPELHWYFGYPLVLGFMLVVVIGMLIYFKRKHWL